jgi:hypothetical protein
MRWESSISCSFVSSECVGRGDGQVAVDVGRLRLAPAVVAELDPAPRDLLVEVLDVVLAERERLDELVESGVLEALVLLAAVEKSLELRIHQVSCLRPMSAQTPRYALGTLTVETRTYVLYSTQTWLARSTSKTPASRL